MKRRSLIVKLLIALLATTTTNGVAAHARAAQETNDATKITAEEQREVLAVVEHFERRMQETGDLAPLIVEMFVPDYAERLRQEAINKPLLLMRKGVAEQASREELARYQLAWNNSLYVFGLLIADIESSQATTGEEEEDEDKLINALPPGVLDLFKNDPVLGGLFEEAQKERAGENKSGAGAGKIGADDEAVEPIQSVEQMRRLTSTLEQATALARKQPGASPVKLPLPVRREGASDEEHRTAERERVNPRAWVLGEEFYGYPKDTRIFCANALMYHLDMVRVGGKLKVLALRLDTN